MRLVLLKHHCYAAPGDILDVGIGVAELLIARGVAREVEPEVKAVEDAPADKSMASPARKGKVKRKADERWQTN